MSINPNPVNPATDPELPQIPSEVASGFYDNTPVDATSDPALTEPAITALGDGDNNTTVSNQDPAAEQTSVNAEATASEGLGVGDNNTTVSPSQDPAAEQADSRIVNVDGDGIAYNRAGQVIDPDSDAAIQQGVVANVDEDGIAYDSAGNRIQTESNASAAASPGAYMTERADTQEDAAAGKASAQSQGAAQNISNFNQFPDWRVRITLAPSAQYLYNANPPGILAPLKQTNGVIFPYNPQISVNYAASYEQQDIAHSNYKLQFYKNSSVGDISITGDFTAQDTSEANYLLAVIHFFRTVTKMFYGQDQSPKPGTPPPLVYLSGYGAYQFDNHPMLISSFNMNLPTDVDYIRTGSFSNAGAVGFNLASYAPKLNTYVAPLQRLLGAKLNPGGLFGAPSFSNLGVNKDVTYVPTKMSIQLTAIPVVTRNDISNNFSVRDYATGSLLRGSKRGTGGGGIW